MSEKQREASHAFVIFSFNYIMWLDGIALAFHMQENNNSSCIHIVFTATTGAISNALSSQISQDLQI